MSAYCIIQDKGLYSLLRKAYQSYVIIQLPQQFVTVLTTNKLLRKAVGKVS